MNERDRTVILKFHEQLTRYYGGGTLKSLGWKAASSQEVRFQILSDIGDLNEHSLLDVGCGHGDLRGFLDDKFPRMHYTGIDQVGDFLEVARNRYGHLPNTCFLQGDFSTMPLPISDYVLACGSLNYRTREPHYVTRMITKLFGACQIAFGFNLLEWVRDPDWLLASYEFEPILAHARQLTPHVVFHRGYLEDDYTLLLYRNPPPAPLGNPT